MNRTNRTLILLLAINLAVSSTALYVALTRHTESAKPLTPQSASPPMGMNNVPTDGLSLRFRHPELFESVHDMARPSALGELVRRGILRPGLDDREAAFLLGDVEEFASEETDDHGFSWHYGMPGGNLVLEFSSQHKLVHAFQTHDGDPDYAHAEKLF